MWYPKKIFLFLSLTIGLSFALSGQWELEDQIPNMGEFNLKGNIPDIDGKIVLIDFWATWCAPCKASFPKLEQLHGKYKDADFLVLAVSVDKDPKALERWKNLYESSFPIVHDQNQALVANAGIKAMPTSFLVNRDGEIVYVHQGFRSGDGSLIEDQIKLLLDD